MQITWTPTDATLGIQIDGVDLRKLDHEVWSAIERAFNDHALLVLPGQHLSEEEQIAFALRFGPLERHTARPCELEEHYGHGEVAAPHAGYRLGTPLVIELSNVTANGDLLETTEHPRARMNLHNQHWHTDSSYKAQGAKASVLVAVMVPPQGGETEFADMRAAYEAVSAGERRQLAGLRAWHSVTYANAMAERLLGTPGADLPDDPRSGPGAEHPVVRTHPVTGRRSLYVGRHACAITGMDNDDAQDMLQRLIAEACHPPRVYRHQWRVGDLVVWDNRCTLHRGLPWDPAHPRVLRHVRVAGDAG